MKFNPVSSIGRLKPAPLLTDQHILTQLNKNVALKLERRKVKNNGSWKVLSSNSSC